MKFILAIFMLIQFGCQTLGKKEDTSGREKLSGREELVSKLFSRSDYDEKLVTVLEAAEKKSTDENKVAIRTLIDALKKGRGFDKKTFKSAYIKASLIIHPDKCEKNEKTLCHDFMVTLNNAKEYYNSTDTSVPAGASWSHRDKNDDDECTSKCWGRGDQPLCTENCHGNAPKCTWHCDGSLKFSL